GVRAEQVAAVEKQLRIRGETLADGARKLEPFGAVAVVQGMLVSLEQRHEPLRQLTHIEGVRVARAQYKLALVERHTLLPGDVAKLRTQVAAARFDAGLVDLDPVL